MPPKNRSPQLPRSPRRPQKPKPPCPTEHADQVALAAWLTLRKVLFCHPPNGYARHIVAARRAKAAGVQRGVPDMLLFSPVLTLRPPGNEHPLYGRRYIGCALELKRATGGQTSHEQRQWLDSLQDMGWLCIVARGFHDAVDQLTAAGY